VAVFVFVFAAVTLVTMAYVVTNFGTLFRLRLLVAAPLWLLPAFLSSPAMSDDATTKLNVAG
jgi:hypothetical protein